MQPLEERAVLELAKELYARDNANPDVGMPPSTNFFLARAAERLGINLADLGEGHTAIFNQLRQHMGHN